MILNGDGRAGILWHNISLQLMDRWLIKGAGRKSIPWQYQVAAIGDFNGDSRGDVFWRDNANTGLWIWRAEPSRAFASDFVGGNPPAGWEVVGKSSNAAVGAPASAQEYAGRGRRTNLSAC